MAKYGYSATTPCLHRTLCTDIEKKNGTILKRMPELLDSRMKSCVAESTDYQSTHSSYIQACDNLEEKISYLKHKEMISVALNTLERYHTSGLRDVHHVSPSTRTMLELHAAQIALFVRHATRRTQFYTIQLHIHALQELIRKHSMSLGNLTHLAKSCTNQPK